MKWQALEIFGKPINTMHGTWYTGVCFKWTKREQKVSFLDVRLYTKVKSMYLLLVEMFLTNP